MNKFKSILLVIIVILSIIFVASCSKKNPANNNDHLSHTYDKINFSKEKHWKECSCGEKIEEENHTFSDWVRIKEPTEETRGIKERECSLCKYKQTEAIIFDNTGSKGLKYQLSEDKESYIVVGKGSATDLDIIIPATYNGKLVTSIGEDAINRERDTRKTPKITQKSLQMIV